MGRRVGILTSAAASLAATFAVLIGHAQVPAQQPAPEQPAQQPDPTQPGNNPQPGPEQPGIRRVPLRIPPRIRQIPGGGVVIMRQASDIKGVDDVQIIAAIHRGTDALLKDTTECVSTAKKMHDDLAKPAAPGPNGIPVAPVIGGRMVDVLDGSASLGVYALLVVGRLTGEARLHYDSPEMKDLVDYVAHIDTKYTYALSLQASALSMLPDRKEIRAVINNVHKNLLLNANDGTYSYTQRSTPLAPGMTGFSAWDNSNTQYGELGAWACEDYGFESSGPYWIAVSNHWRGEQQQSGGWGYLHRTTASPGNPNAIPMMDEVRPSMTAAGLASLYLAIDRMDFVVRNNPRVDRALENGIAWLAKEFPNYQMQLAGDLYLAYGIERVGLASGLKYFGTNEWFRAGAAEIIATQQQTGEWYYGAGNAPVCGTAYALLFLTRGVAPVAFGKLQYNGPWNSRERDAARITHWLSKKAERHLNWQVLSLDDSSPNTWSNIPVLVITGKGDPKFTNDQIAALKTYVDNGGLILSSADTGDPVFTDAIKKKYAPAVAGGAYEMRELPSDHPIFTLAYPQKHVIGKTYGLSNGVRELWIHAPEDWGAKWQSYGVASTASFEVPGNIYFYATGMSQPPIRYDALEPPMPPTAGTATLVRLEHPGNWDPEPAAWNKFAQHAAQKHGLEVKFVTQKINDLDPTKNPIVVMAGTTAFTISDDQKAKLKAFFDGGGVLLADATGGSEAFANSFKDMIVAVLPGEALEDLPADSLVLTGKFAHGEPIDDLRRNRFSALGAARARPVNLQGVQHHGRTAIIFSPGDLTASQLGIRTWGIIGYDTDQAQSLAWNALLYLSAGAGATGPTPASQQPDVAPPDPNAPVPAPYKPADTVAPDDTAK